METRHTPTIGEESIQLCLTEGRFLQLLCAKGDEIANREYLVKGIWENAIISKAKELKKYASILRRQLKADSSLKIEYQKTNYEEGYTLITGMQ